MADTPEIHSIDCTDNWQGGKGCVCMYSVLREQLAALRAELEDYRDGAVQTYLQLTAARAENERLRGERDEANADAEALAMALNSYLERWGPEHEDAGPRGETWTSDEHRQRVAAAQVALATRFARVVSTAGALGG